MQLTFPGTRANLTISTPQHLYHSCLLVEYAGTRLLIDCGRDWSGRLAALRPETILLTHGHDDHCGGLPLPLPVPVVATTAAWDALPDLATDPLARHCQTAEALTFGHIRATPLTVGHSLRAPAVGWRLETGARRIFYAPDIAALDDPSRALDQLDLYIGDGSSFDSSLERSEAGVPCGHAAIPRQLDWCHEAGVRRVLFSHCGEMVLQDEAEAARRLAELAASYRIDARFAVDGQSYRL